MRETGGDAEFEPEVESEPAPLTLAERLSRWDGEEFRAVDPGSVTAQRVFVLSHGWAPGLGTAAEAAGGRLRVWDEDAVATTGRRFDGWYRELGNAILEQDSDAAILCFSWVDDSATGTAPTDSVISQRRTQINGLRLQWALHQALAAPDRARVHLIGHSHGSRVVTVAALLLAHPPVHLTILDSPDEAVSAMGGAANDLPALLRILMASYSSEQLFVDNYVSQFGQPYGHRPGLGDVVDVLLTGPQPDVGVGSPNPHGYAWAWYVASARRTDPQVGFAWSRAGLTRALPGGAVLEQSRQPGADALDLEVKEHKRTRVAVNWAPDVYRRTVSKVFDTGHGRDLWKSHGWFFRHIGAAFVRVSVTWLEGPPDAVIEVIVGRRTLLRLTREQTELTDGVVLLPLMDLPTGPTRVTTTLRSEQPAVVRVSPDYTIATLDLPRGAEIQRYIRPAFVGASTALTVGVGFYATRAVLRRVVRRVRRRS